MPVGDIDAIGLLFALIAAGGWAAYIVLSRAAGQQSPGIGALGIAMAVAAVLVAPAGLGGGAALIRPGTLAQGGVVAVLAGLVPFSLEMIALRSVTARVFGVLMSLSPAAAAASGYAVLGQRLSPIDAIGIALVMTASVAMVKLGDRPEAEAVPHGLAPTQEPS